jgi:hypothetical protein
MRCWCLRSTSNATRCEQEHKQKIAVVTQQRAMLFRPRLNQIVIDHVYKQQVRTSGPPRHP